MHYTHILAAAAAVTNVYAFSFADESSSSIKRSPDAVLERSGGGNSCPPIWTSVVKELTSLFLDTTNGQCNDAARAAIRVSRSSHLSITIN
jgi:hypothetical protein